MFCLLRLRRSEVMDFDRLMEAWGVVISEQWHAFVLLVKEVSFAVLTWEHLGLALFAVVAIWCAESLGDEAGEEANDGN
jgi:hypothetical protein